MKSVCIIPARGGSKGVPKKNIRKINGKPLLAYVIESCINSEIFDHVIVSTEDNQIANIAKKYGAEVPFKRPKNLATDYATMDSVLLHAVKELKRKNYNFETFVWRDATTPFIRSIDIKNCIKLLKKKNAPIVSGVYEQHLNPYFNIVETKKNGFLKLCKPLKVKARSRQEAPKVLQLNGLYVYNTEKFLKMKKTDLGKTLPYIIPMETGVMIDTEFEFMIVKLFFEKFKIKSIK